MKKKCISIGKPEAGCINEDAAMSDGNKIAISDGAGGGGLFAERWSRYLLDHLPDAPIFSAEDLDCWLESIWEPFYNVCEEDAKMLGGMPLEKFYSEGSFATLVAVWKTAENECKWISYGDSVAFHYNYATHQLQHSFTSLPDFDNSPYLINCKEELNKGGFRQGTFYTDSQPIVFVASDALAHYIIMMYEIRNSEMFKDDIEHVLGKQTKNTNYIKTAMTLKKIDFENKVLKKLIQCVGNFQNFARHTSKLQRIGLLAYDDYSLAVL